MSVILEFSIESEEFQLGRVLARPPQMQLELERIVPTGNMIMPFVWATGDDHEGFEANVQSHSSVKEFVTLDRIGNSGLYRVVWEQEPSDLIEGIGQSNAVVLEAQGNSDWVFRIRFPDHDRLSEFHNYVIELDIPIHIERTYTLTETTERGHRFDLSKEQREALVLALQRGYFETPSEVSLDDLADDLSISRQAVSDRIRRGNEKILHRVLLSSSSRFD